jgi:hypothetical protein
MADPFDFGGLSLNPGRGRAAPISLSTAVVHTQPLRLTRGFSVGDFDIDPLTTGAVARVADDEIAVLKSLAGRGQGLIEPPGDVSLEPNSKDGTRWAGWSPSALAGDDAIRRVENWRACADATSLRVQRSDGNYEAREADEKDKAHAEPPTEDSSGSVTLHALRAASEPRVAGLEITQSNVDSK